MSLSAEGTNKTYFLRGGQQRAEGVFTLPTFVSGKQIEQDNGVETKEFLASCLPLVQLVNYK